MKVHHSQGSYEVAFCDFQTALDRVPENAIFITDENVNLLYGARLPQPPLVVPAGETSKSVGRWAELQSQLAKAGANRKTTVVAFGGGVIGDLAGFVAATYMRGVPLIQVPTTLLSQVDSSVGGKVGIDLPEGKNLVGSFYPPHQVLICEETLDTLPEREYTNGMAEVWKCAFILDAPLVDELRAGTITKKDMVHRCIEHKRMVVETDEFETTGERAKLNFGHTVGHAIEKITGYGPILHGEAISIGMVCEAALGEAIGLSEKGTRAAVEDCLHSQGLPTASVVLRNVDMLIETMRRDKKADAGQLAFSLLLHVGSCKLIESVPESDVRAVLKSL